MFQCERPCRKECFRPQIARRVQFRHPFVAKMSRFCAIHGTSDFFQLICCNLDRTDTKRTCCGRHSRNQMPELESLGDSRPKRLCQTSFFSRRYRRASEGMHRLDTVSVTCVPVRPTRLSSSAKVFINTRACRNTR